MIALGHPAAALALGAAFVLSSGCFVPAARAEPVDVELIIAADVSLSMSQEELRIQREGYVAALTHDSVINAIKDGIHGRIAISIFEWAGENSQFLVVPWTVIESREDAENVVAQMSENPPRSARRTSISGALLYAGDRFAESQFTGMRRVLDVSGDGPNNSGPPVVPERDALVAQGVIINGLPLMTNMGPAGRFDIDDLDDYYANCVIGGPGSFSIPVTEWADFPEAVRRKIVLELAGPWSPTWRRYAEKEARVMRVSMAEGYDCLIGERRWGGGLVP
ncbi:MAG: DUF1194 domain-containing protein [Rhizobiaceae bacterium]